MPHSSNSTSAASNQISGSKALVDYQFFIQYTYTAECALLAYNFTKTLEDMEIFSYFNTLPDHRVIAVQLMYLFYKYQVHHNDMALDLALTLHYVEDAKSRNILEMFQRSEGFNFIMYCAFLAHVWNNDRTVKLCDWFKEVGWQTFQSQQQLNLYVMFLFRDFRQYKLRGSTERTKAFVLKLCTAPDLAGSNVSTLSSSTHATHLSSASSVDSQTAHAQQYRQRVQQQQQQINQTQQQQQQFAPGRAVAAPTY